METKDLIDLFTVGHYSNDKDDVGETFKQVSKFYAENPRHQYYKISKYVCSKMEDEQDSISYILNNILNLKTVIQYQETEYSRWLSEKMIHLTCDDITNKLNKLYDHIALEEERLINNDKSIRRSGQLLEENLTYNFNSMAKEFSDKFNDMSNGQSANIMTIVGLFSAVIFVFFGGVTGLSSVINGIFQLKTKEDLTIPIILILIIGLILFNIVFVLLYTIAKILDKNIGRKVSTGIYGFYWYNQVENCFCIYDYNGEKKFCVIDDITAKKKCSRKNKCLKIRKKIRNMINVIIFRYPIVFLFNAISIGFLTYLYMNI